MDQLRATPALALVALVGVTVAAAAVAIFSYPPAFVPPEPALPPQRDTTAHGVARQTTSVIDDRDLLEERLRRLQQLVRAQRLELELLREQLDPRPAEQRPARPRQTEAGLLSGLKVPDLSVLTGRAEEAGYSRDELAAQLAAVRATAAELQEQLRAAETVLDMQLAENEELQQALADALQESRHRVEEGSTLGEVADALLRESRELETVATTALRSMGPSAAAILLPLLEDERPHVRRWARELLTGITEDEERRREQADSEPAPSSADRLPQ